mmetsp:Transcript_73369/g.174804  ORF Transcript_73369/g.174804 Transcript_73369/m.174804 type:complete len:89 (+) Transcript_73369:2532-2798(+)
MVDEVPLPLNSLRASRYPAAPKDAATLQRHEEVEERKGVLAAPLLARRGGQNGLAALAVVTRLRTHTLAQPCKCQAEWARMSWLGPLG